MAIDPNALADLITSETGLTFVGKSDPSSSGFIGFELTPSGYLSSQTFRIRSRILWRTVEVEFVPGSFSGELVAHMSQPTNEARTLFTAILQSCIQEDASIRIVANGKERHFSDTDLWADAWRSVTIGIRKGQLPIGEGDDAADLSALGKWTGRLASAVVALMPLETAHEEADSEIEGYPEGARIKVEVNRYERDRRNRSAAIAIHGYRCKGCDQLLLDMYGEAGKSLIEIHHVTPVSQLSDGYVINPAKDLVPLCPNCHAVVHTQTPPLTLEMLREAIRKANDSRI